MATPDPRPKKADGPRTLTDLAYMRLRDDIIHGHLAPNERLRIEPLRKAYELGATPLREALSRLTADGFVNAEGQRGFKVADMNAADLADVTDMRVLLESQALTRSVLHGDDEWESRVVAAFHRLTKIEQIDRAERDLQDWEARNSDFHDALISACTSRWLRRFYATLYDQHKRYRNIARTNKPPKRDVHAEHQAIFDAAMARDVEGVCKANEAHLRATLEVVGQLMRDKWQEKSSDR